MGGHDDNEPMLEQLRKQYAIERKNLLADMAERQRHADAERVLAEARHATTNVRRDPVVTKSYAPSRRAAAPAPDNLTEGWVRYIREQLDARERAMRRAVAQVVVEEERAREALERRCERLETELAELRNRLDQERGARGLRAVPSTPAAPGIMIA